MQDPTTEKPVRQQELPSKNEPVQKQPANDRPVEGQGITEDQWAQERPTDRNERCRISNQVTVEHRKLRLASNV